MSEHYVLDEMIIRIEIHMSREAACFIKQHILTLVVQSSQNVKKNASFKLDEQQSHRESVFIVPSFCTLVLFVLLIKTYSSFSGFQ